MVRSMTGYGRGESLLHNRKIVVEIKSVNHRYNDINIKMPRIMNCFEDKLRKKLSGTIQRGKTDVYISLETISKDDVKINVDEALAGAYANALKLLKERFSLPGSVSLQAVAGFPDVITVEKSADDEKALLEIWETLEQSTEMALTHFICMRQKEGEALQSDILSKLFTLRKLLDKAKARGPFVAEEYRARLKTRLADLLENTGIDENRLLMEAAIFADRSCIDEEMTRIDSHLNQLAEALTESDAIGRKLDFLVQEINREVNTMGSKSNDLKLTKIVVDLKSEVEKVREQIQNIE